MSSSLAALHPVLDGPARKPQARLQVLRALPGDWPCGPGRLQARPATDKLRSPSLPRLPAQALLQPQTTIIAKLPPIVELF
jgi:hypothetical protein